MRLKKFKMSNNKKKIIVTVMILSVLVLSSIYLYGSFAIFTEEKHFNVINGEIGDPGDIYFAYYVDGEITRSMPSQNTGYTLDTGKSNCTNGVTPNWNNEAWTFEANYSNYNATDYTRTKCNLYFEKTSKIVSTALGNIDVNKYTPDFTKSACDDETCESHEKGIYETTDDNGTSYYYRGSVENNYVKFAGYYWRIIRINGNGSIRMIYDGTVAHDNGEESDDRIASTTKFNVTSDYYFNAGYMYSDNEFNGHSSASVIKTSNDKFYQDNLTNYQDYFDINTGFCGDRSIMSTDANDDNLTYYTSYYRYTMNDPSLICGNINDNYTISSANNGNKALTYPIGLITMDEALYAGYSTITYIPNNNNNSKYYKYNPTGYLSIKSNYWTMTPVGFFNPAAWSYRVSLIFRIRDDNILWAIDLVYDYGLRPVINLKSTLKFTGDGTKESPYIPSL